MVRKLNIDGDAQANLAGHGAEQRAVFVYQADSCPYWELVLGRKDRTFAQFAENFTVEGLADDEVSIGDRYRISDAVFEVTQPRVSCDVGTRMNEPHMPAVLVAYVSRATRDSTPRNMFVGWSQPGTNLILDL
jgi:MOSC domain-containing protein YiiM